MGTLTTGNTPKVDRKQLFFLTLKLLLLHTIAMFIFVSIPALLVYALKVTPSGNPSSLIDFLIINIQKYAFLILAVVVPFLSIINTEVVKRLSNYNLKNRNDSISLISFMNSLDKIVQAKADRFGEFAKKITNKPYTDDNIFEEITRPEEQIKLIPTAIHTSLKAITSKNHNFYVSIAIVNDDGTKYDWCSMSEPNEAQTRIVKALNNMANNPVKKCINEKDAIIIEDVSKVSDTGNGRDEACSLICYPVDYQAGNIPYVITVFADQLYFTESMRNSHSWFFGKFVVRMQLEYSLLLIKKSRSTA